MSGSSKAELKKLALELSKNSLKFDYFGGVVYNRIKNHIFSNERITIKIHSISSMRQMFLSRGGHYMVIQVFHNKIHIADIGMRFLNPEGRKVIIKSVFVQPVGYLKMLLNDIKSTGTVKRLKLIHRVDANPLKKIFIRPQAIVKITQSLLNETEGWLTTCSEFLNS